MNIEDKNNEPLSVWQYDAENASTCKWEITKINFETMKNEKKQLMK